MGIDRESIKPFASPLVGFGGEVMFPMGIIPLPVTAGTVPQLAIVMIDFLVIDRPSAYYAIMGRPALNKFKAATSTYHLMMKFPTEEGVGVVRGDQLTARKCYNTSMKKVPDSTTLTVQRGTSRAARGSFDWGWKGLADRNLFRERSSRRPCEVPS
jgi:hypothetical protein